MSALLNDYVGYSAVDDLDFTNLFVVANYYLEHPLPQDKNRVLVKVHKFLHLNAAKLKKFIHVKKFQEEEVYKVQKGNEEYIVNFEHQNPFDTLFLEVATTNLLVPPDSFPMEKNMLSNYYTIVATVAMLELVVRKQVQSTDTIDEFDLDESLNWDYLIKIVEKLPSDESVNSFDIPSFEPDLDAAFDVPSDEEFEKDFENIDKTSNAFLLDKYGISDENKVGSASFYYYNGEADACNVVPDTRVELFPNMFVNLADCEDVKSRLKKRQCYPFWYTPSLSDDIKTEMKSSLNDESDKLSSFITFEVTHVCVNPYLSSLYSLLQVQHPSLLAQLESRCKTDSQLLVRSEDIRAYLLELSALINTKLFVWIYQKNWEQLVFHKLGSPVGVEGIKANVPLCLFVYDSIEADTVVLPLIPITYATYAYS
jgi:hypothetical protein